MENRSLDLVAARQDMNASLVEQASASELDASGGLGIEGKTMINPFPGPLGVLTHGGNAPPLEVDGIGGFEATQRALLLSPNWVRLPGLFLQRSQPETSSISAGKSSCLATGERPLKTLFTATQRKDVSVSATSHDAFGGQALDPVKPKTSRDQCHKGILAPGPEGQGVQRACGG
jgi:hypothetical protein